MAELSSIQGEIQLTFRLLGKNLDPFQKDLEWFDYELAVETASSVGSADSETAKGLNPAEPRGRSGRGKINRKDFNEFLRGLDELTEHGQPLRFEPYDLNFYLEWTHETTLVYLIVVWFDLALSPRRLDQRFPSCHEGFRFLADAESLVNFRRAVEKEFLEAGRPSEPAEQKPSSLIH